MFSNYETIIGTVQLKVFLIFTIYTTLFCYYNMAKVATFIDRNYSLCYFCWVCSYFFVHFNTNVCFEVVNSLRALWFRFVNNSRKKNCGRPIWRFRWPIKVTWIFCWLFNLISKKMDGRATIFLFLVILYMEASPSHS